MILIWNIANDFPPLTRKEWNTFRGLFFHTNFTRDLDFVQQFQFSQFRILKIISIFISCEVLRSKHHLWLISSIK